MTTAVYYETLMEFKPERDFFTHLLVLKHVHGEALMRLDIYLTVACVLIVLQW